MNKPKIETVLQIKELKERIDEMYNEIDLLLGQIVDEHSAGRYDYDLLTEVPVELKDSSDDLTKNGRYLKLEITDNARELTMGRKVWKSSPVSPLSFKVQSLKRCPTSLK